MTKNIEEPLTFLVVLNMIKEEHRYRKVKSFLSSVPQEATKDLPLEANKDNNLLLLLTKEGIFYIPSLFKRQYVLQKNKREAVQNNIPLSPAQYQETVKTLNQVYQEIITNVIYANYEKNKSIREALATAVLVKAQELFKDDHFEELLKKQDYQKVFVADMLSHLFKNAVNLVSDTKLLEYLTQRVLSPQPAFKDLSFHQVNDEFTPFLINHDVDCIRNLEMISRFHRRLSPMDLLNAYVYSSTPILCGYLAGRYAQSISVSLGVTLGMCVALNALNQHRFAEKKKAFGVAYLGQRNRALIHSPEYLEKSLLIHTLEDDKSVLRKASVSLSLVESLSLRYQMIKEAQFYLKEHKGPVVCFGLSAPTQWQDDLVEMCRVGADEPIKTFVDKDSLHITYRKLFYNYLDDQVKYNLGEWGLTRDHIAQLLDSMLIQTEKNLANAKQIKENSLCALQTLKLIDQTGLKSPHEIVAILAKSWMSDQKGDTQGGFLSINQKDYLANLKKRTHFTMPQFKAYVMQFVLQQKNADLLGDSFLKNDKEIKDALDNLLNIKETGIQTATYICRLPRALNIHPKVKEMLKNVGNERIN